jgi:hypothetical protein
MNAHGFTSAFAPELDAYLAFKEKMGFYGSSRIWYLKRFDAYCTAHDQGRLRPGHGRRMGHRAAGPIEPVPVLDVLHPRRRPVAAGPRAQ